jgi:hypothetical protein
VVELQNEGFEVVIVDDLSNISGVTKTQLKTPPTTFLPTKKHPV